MPETNIAPADFDDPALAVFLAEHLADMAPTAPPESQHALDIDALQAPNVDLWVLHEEGELVGTAALVDLGERHSELKSMRTAPHARGRGVATRLLEHVLADARSRGVERISLETGAQDYFAPAHALYAVHGFTPCPPFADYTDDPCSEYFTLVL